MGDEGLQLVYVPAAAAATAATAAAGTAAATTAVRPDPGSALKRTRTGLPRPGGTGVRVHVVAGYDMHADVAGRPAGTVPGPSRERHRRFAATVVEQVDVRVPEVPVPGAIHQVVEARLAQGQPR